MVLTSLRLDLIPEVSSIRSDALVTMRLIASEHVRPGGLVLITIRAPVVCFAYEDDHNMSDGYPSLFILQADTMWLIG